MQGEEEGERGGSKGLRRRESGSDREKERGTGSWRERDAVFRTSLFKLFMPPRCLKQLLKYRVALRRR